MPDAWIATPNAVQWEGGSGTVTGPVELARLLREDVLFPDVKEGTIYRKEGSVVGHWLWKP